LWEILIVKRGYQEIRLITSFCSTNQIKNYQPAICLAAGFLSISDCGIGKTYNLAEKPLVSKALRV
jgi:hypothetical protein